MKCLYFHCRSQNPHVMRIVCTMWRGVENCFCVICIDGLEKSGKNNTSEKLNMYKNLAEIHLFPHVTCDTLPNHKIVIACRFSLVVFCTFLVILRRYASNNLCRQTNDDNSRMQKWTKEKRRKNTRKKSSENRCRLTIRIVYNAIDASTLGYQLSTFHFNGTHIVFAFIRLTEIALPKVKVKHTHTQPHKFPFNIECTAVFCLYIFIS